MAFGESPSKLRRAKNGILSRLVYAIWVEPDPGNSKASWMNVMLGFLSLSNVVSSRMAAA